MINALFFLALVGLALAVAEMRGRLRTIEMQLRATEDRLRKRMDANEGLRETPVTLPPSAPHPMADPLSSAERGNSPMSKLLAAYAGLAASAKAVQMTPRGQDRDSPSPHATVQLAPVSPPEAVKRRGLSFGFEDLFGRLLPIWAGGITLAVAGIFIVKYAIDAGLLTPWTRIMGGLLFGGGLIVAAEGALRKARFVDDPRVAQTLSGAGIATLYATVLMAHTVYGLIGPLAAFLAMAMITFGALGLSLRFGTPSALLGLAGGLAAPALVGSLQPNIPLLSGYLALTIGGLTAVSRRQKWLWLGLAALAGGGLWTLWLILTSALNGFETLSIGTLILLLAILLPMANTKDMRSAAMRAGAAIIGLSQIALLVAQGGYSTISWGLFALIAAACQWLSWRDRTAGGQGDRALALLPAAGLVVGSLLLFAWPGARPGTVLLIGGALAIIFALPLFTRLWVKPYQRFATLEWSGLAVMIVVTAVRHYYAIDGSHDGVLSSFALLGTVFCGVALVAGWKRIERRQGEDYAILAAVGAFLASCAAWFALPAWLLPVAVVALAAGLLTLADRAQDAHVEKVAAGFAVTAIIALGMDREAYLIENGKLVGAGEGQAGHGVLRWGALALAAGYFAIGAHRAVLRRAGQMAAALFAYATLAQFLPAAWLMVIAPLGLLALACAAQRRPAALGWPVLAPAALVAAGIAFGWALPPLGQWLGQVVQSLAGMPVLAQNLPDIGIALKHVALPTVIIAGAAWMNRNQLPAYLHLALAAILGIAAAVTWHIVYRLGFAALAGDDFIGSGMAQRAVWAALLLAAGWMLHRSYGASKVGRFAAFGLACAAALYLGYYSFLIHNPLLGVQAVGSLPVVNWLMATCGLGFAALWLVDRTATSLAPPSIGIIHRVIAVVRMLLVVYTGLGFLTQLFHGDMLAAVTVGNMENILRSILAIILATGFLLWGIRTRQRNWRIGSLALMLVAVGKVFLFDASGLTGLTRIASFMALGFSLIGIGWLYSRQLRSETRRARSGKDTIVRS